MSALAEAVVDAGAAGGTLAAVPATHVDVPPAKMPISQATFVVLDTETTGLDVATDEVVEIAAAALTRWIPTPLAMFATLVRPTKAVPPEASGIHHLSNRDLERAPSSAAAMVSLDLFLSRFDRPVLVTHHAEFDLGILPKSSSAHGLPVVCSMRLAQHLVPSGPTNYKNQTLRYYFDLEVDTFGIGSHRALADVLVTGALFQKLLTLDGCPRAVEDLIELAASPLELKTMPFGMHKGEPIDDVPADYIAWCFRNMSDMSSDLRFTLTRSMERRTKLASA